MNSAITAKESTATAWRTVRLANVCQFKPPKSIPRQSLDYDTPVSFVPMGDLGELTKYFKAKSTRKFGEVVKGYTYFADGDVLCAKITPCFENGKLGIAQNLENSVGFGSSEFVVMRSMGEILPEYLYYYLSRDAFREAGKALMSGAVGHKRVPKEYFENLEIPLPPLDVQKRIVAVLDQTFTGLDHSRTHCELNIQSAIELFQSFIEAVLSRDTEGWYEKPLKLLGEIRTGSTPKTTNYNDFGYHIPFVKPGNFNANGTISFEKKGLSFEGAKKARVIPSGSAMMVCIGTIGKAGFTDQKIATNQQINSITPNENILGEFLYYQFLTKRFQRQVRNNASQTTLPIVNKSKWSNLIVAIPPEIDIQRNIVDKLRAIRFRIDHLIDRYETKLSQLTYLRSELLEKAFSGDLT